MLSSLRVCGILVCLLFTSLALAQDFSADVVTTKQNSGFKKFYATKDKLRVDADPQEDRMGLTAMIVDETQNRWYVVFGSRHMYMDSLPTMIRKPLITQFWHVDDVDDACPQWKKFAEQEGTASNWGSCTRIGNDTVNGRSTVKYEGVDKQGSKVHYWVDRKLRCVIKGDGENGGGIELRNIQEASQPASLFEIPAGYTKVDPSALMRSQE